MSFLRVSCDAARGLQCPKENAKYGRGENRLATILSNHDDARDQLFRIFPSGKTGTRRREHRVYWVPSSVYWFPESFLDFSHLRKNLFFLFVNARTC